MKMSKWAVIVIIVSLATAVIILSISLRQWVDKARDAYSEVLVLDGEVHALRRKTHVLSEEVHVLRGLLKEKTQKDITIPERREILEDLRYMPGEVLVMFKEELTNEEKITLINKWHLEVIEKVILTDIYRLKVPRSMTVSEGVEKLEKLEEVKHAQPNWIYIVG